MTEGPQLDPLPAEALEMLRQVSTSTVATQLYKRGFRQPQLLGVRPLSRVCDGFVAEAFTMRFIPAREDKARNPAEGPIQQQAMEGCPPGHVLVVDARGDPRAASAGDLYCGRLKARGCAGIVTDGGLRDTDGIAKTGLVAYHRRPSSPPSGIVHQPVDLGLPIACGGVAVYPGDVIVGDGDGVVVIPPEIVDMVAEDALATTLYDEFAEEEVAKGRSLIGLFPAAGDDAKRDFAAWKKARGYT